MSRPARGAWIETVPATFVPYWTESRPARGAWIETRSDGGCWKVRRVAPRAGRVD